MGVFEAIGNDSHERVVVGNDPSTGLRAIIAIYSTELGPALGGTRLFPYDSVLTVLERASDEGVNPHEAAVRFDEDRIRREGTGTTFRHGGGE